MCQRGASLITQGLTWDVKLSTASAAHWSRRRLGATKEDWDLNLCLLNFTPPHLSPYSCPVEQWRQYFVTDSLRLLGTQRRPWESSPARSLSLLSLPPSQSRSLSWHNSCSLSASNNTRIPSRTFTIRIRRTAHPHINPYPHTNGKTHAAFGDSKAVIAFILRFLNAAAAVEEAEGCVWHRGWGSSTFHGCRLWRKTHRNLWAVRLIWSHKHWWRQEH